MSNAIEQLAKDGELTADTFQQAVLDDMINKIDWANMPVEEYVEELNSAKTAEAHEKVIKTLGGLISFDNRAAFHALLMLFQLVFRISLGDELHWMPFGGLVYLFPH